MGWRPWGSGVRARGRGSRVLRGLGSRLRAPGSPGKPEGRFCEWEGPGSGSMETPGSPARCVPVAAAAAAAQCPALGTPRMGGSRGARRSQPAGRIREVAPTRGAGSRAGDPDACDFRHPQAREGCWGPGGGEPAEGLMTPRSCGRAEVLLGPLGRIRARSTSACVERARVARRALQSASWGALGAESSQRREQGSEVTARFGTATGLGQPGWKSFAKGPAQP